MIFKNVWEPWAVVIHLFIFFLLDDFPTTYQQTNLHKWFFCIIFLCVESSFRTTTDGHWSIERLS